MQDVFPGAVFWLTWAFYFCGIFRAITFQLLSNDCKFLYPFCNAKQFNHKSNNQCSFLSHSVSLWTLNNCLPFLLMLLLESRFQFLTEPECLLTSYRLSNNNYCPICGLSLLIVLSCSSRGHSPGTLVFPSPQKSTLSNFSSFWNAQIYISVSS